MSANTIRYGRRLEGKVCVVTGAAGVIGTAVCERLGAEGGRVVGVDLLDHETGELPLTVDLIDEELTRALFERVHAQFGRIDVIVNNAGRNDLEDSNIFVTSTETWRRVFDANLTTTFLCCKYGIPYLRQNDPSGGSVVNVSSFLAAMGAATAQMAFAAAKAGVVALTRDLGVHLARTGVRVNSLLLGPVDSPLIDAMYASNPEARQKRMIHMPMGRFGTIDEVAGTIAYLASEDSGFMTASALPLDGGIVSAYTVPESSD
jgi:NAD(P)-dependent dehydrogenase (short-subunit alcohol dehydrogenase family)